MKNESKIVLNHSAKEAILQIKRALAQSTGFAYPTADAKLCLYTNASKKGIGAVFYKNYLNHQNKHWYIF